MRRCTAPKATATDLLPSADPRLPSPPTTHYMATMDVDAPAPATLKRTRGESLLNAFAEYRAELDTHYDRRERIIKQSRDITAQSKKLIFSAHR
jgi:hypothetical protein